MSRIAVIQVPYHLGHEGRGMGAGPDALVDAGLAKALERGGHAVEVGRVERPDGQANEIGASFAVLRAVAEHARTAVERGAFPLALAANCMTSVALLAALGRGVGVVWLDAHPDFNTTEGTTSGFADGMGLSILTGTGWDGLRATIPGYRAVPEEHVVLVGIRDVEPPERERLDASSIAALAPAELDGLEPALDALRARVDEIHLHLDLDVLDPAEGRANEYAEEGGLTADEVARTLDAVAARFALSSAAITAYNPAVDPDGRIPPIATALAGRVAAAVGSRVPEPTA
jgi:arginase